MDAFAQRSLGHERRRLAGLYPVPELAAACRARPEGEIPLCPIRQNVVLCLLPERLAEVNAESAGNLRLQTLREAGQTKIGQFTAMTIGAGDELWVVGENGVAQVAGPQRSLSAASEWRESIPPEALRLHNLRRPEPDESGLTLVADAAEEGRRMQVHFDGAHWEARALGAANIQFAWRGPDNTSWAAASNALYRWRGGELETVTNLSPRVYLDAGVDWRGTFWLATSEGLVRFTPALWRAPEAGAKVNAAVQRLAEGELVTDVAGQLITFDSDPASRAVLAIADGRRVFSRRLGLLRDGRVCLRLCRWTARAPAAGWKRATGPIFRRCRSCRRTPGTTGIFPACWRRKRATCGWGEPLARPG